jgi:UPF0755 protein
MKKKDSLFASILFLMLLAHLIAGYVLLTRGYNGVFEEHDIPLSGRKLTVQKGESLNAVLQILHDQHLAPDPVWVKIAMKIKGRTFILKKGSYSLNKKMSSWQILELLDRGRVIMKKMTIREGLDKWQTAEVLGKTRWGTKEQFEELIESGSKINKLDPEAEDLEGYLFPETYTFEPGTQPEKIVDTILMEFEKQVLADLPRAQKMGLTLREWVTLASMVEKEAARDSERGRIAGVFMNRRKKGIAYQCDPTIVYALKKAGKYRGKIYLSDLKFQSPYNTYVVSSLPPGPIANPGIKSLRAVLNYEIHDFLFFVAQNNGTHHFSKTLSEHNRYVRKYQR